MASLPGATGCRTEKAMADYRSAHGPDVERPLSAHVRPPQAALRVGIATNVSALLDSTDLIDRSTRKA